MPFSTQYRTRIVIRLQPKKTTPTSGIAFAVTLAAADVAGNPEDSQAALDAAGAMIRSFEYLRRLHGRKVAEALGS